MNVLVLNAGSSSVKYQLLHVESKEVLTKGACERIGAEDGIFTHGMKPNEVQEIVAMPDHENAIGRILQCLVEGSTAVLKSLDEIDAVGHRIVQGGKYFKGSTIVDDDVIAKIDELSVLAPLHNKPELQGIYACQKLMPGTPMVTVYDSAFFFTLPPKAYMYPVPYEYYEKYGIRKYGAHGTSHKYVAQRAAEFLGKPLKDLKLITCHLGNGCSISAIKDGIAVDTSMGLTPLDGIMMGTRSGSIDPTVVTFVMEHENMTPEEANTMLNKKSGLLGISGVSNDARDIETACEQGNERAKLAYDMYAYSVQKCIGQYIAVLGGVDAVVLTAGLGENSSTVRELIFKDLEPMGMKIDPELNAVRGPEREISAADSKVKLLVIPTNEELAIAQDTYDLVMAARNA